MTDTGPTFLDYLALDAGAGVHEVAALNEDVKSSRYAIETNFRSTAAETLTSFAKLALGFVSAALKRDGYHIKHVFDDTKPRIVIASRNFDDGEWVGMAHWDEKQAKFIVSEGFYNRDRRTVGVERSKPCAGDAASDVTRDLRSLMHDLRHRRGREQDKYKPVPMKRGPKS